MNKYLLTADVKKMFRQILVNESDVIYQKIFYRRSQNEPVNEYVLLTVTYGCTSSPYLSVRVMLQMADDYEHKYPLAANALRNSRYVDDITAGAETHEELNVLFNELQGIMAEAKMELSKWRTNNVKLAELMGNELDISDQDLMFDENGTSVLGMLWSPIHDTFRFRIRSEWNSQRAVTKRTIVGAVAEIFDPLGLIAPVAIKSKIFIQNLWKNNVSWDDRLEPDLANQWVRYYNSLPELNDIRIDRWVQLKEKAKVEC